MVSRSGINQEEEFHNLVRLRSPLAPIAAEEPAAVSARAGARPSQPALARRTG